MTKYTQAPEGVHFYLAGPMSGIPQYNIPLFDEVATTLRSRGFQVTSPAELDSASMREEALKDIDGTDIAFDDRGNHELAGETWGDCLARDVKLIADSDINGIIFLPHWHKSRGARLEAFVALLQGNTFSWGRWNPGLKDVTLLPREVIVRNLQRQLA